MEELKDCNAKWERRGNPLRDLQKHCRFGNEVHQWKGRHAIGTTSGYVVSASGP